MLREPRPRGQANWTRVPSASEVDRPTLGHLLLRRRVARRLPRAVAAGPWPGDLGGDSVLVMPARSTCPGPAPMMRQRPEWETSPRVQEGAFAAPAVS